MPKKKKYKKRVRTKGYFKVGKEKFPIPMLSKAEMTKVMKNAMRNPRYLKEKIASGEIW